MNETIITNETIDTQTTDTTIDGQVIDATQMPQLPPPPPMMQLGEMSFGGQMPTIDASQMPALDGTQQAFDPTQMPTLDASQMPAIDGTQQVFDPTQMPTLDASQMPALDGTQQVSTDGTQQLGQPPMMQLGGQMQLGQGFMQAPPDMNMWGNSEFAGEQIFNGENFVTPDDLGSITDASTDISVNLGDQSGLGFGFGFGFPPAGMPPVMDGGQIAEQSASTETQAE